MLRQINEVGCTTPGIVIVQGTETDYSEVKAVLPSDWKITTLPHNHGICGAMQWFFNHHPHEPFYGLVCDDEHVFTPGWDRTLIEAAGKNCISHGNDGWQSERRIHGYATWGGDLLRAVRWWAIPGLWHWYFDDVWERIAADLNLRRWCPEVKVEHKHYLAGKTEKDATYAAGESMSRNDQRVFYAWLNYEWPHLRQMLQTRAAA